MKNLIFIILTSIFSISIHAQTAKLNKAGLSDKEIDRINSERQIKALKNGALLIRLGTKQPTLTALKNKGNHEAANAIEAQLNQENKAIIDAFATYFDFCNVYFFFSHDSELVKEDKLDSVSFLNASLVPDETISIDENYILIGDFARLRPDTAIIETDTYYFEGEDGLEIRTRHEGGGNFGFEALLFFSQEMYQLRKPFPYYARTLQSLPIFRRSYGKTVRMANSALNSYYKSIVS